MFGKPHLQLHQWKAIALSFAVIGLMIVCFSGSTYGNELNNKGASVSAASEKKGVQAGKEVVLEIGPKPIKTMKILSFQVNLSGYQEPPKILIDLSMPGMFMGINRFYLKRKAPGLYKGQRIIPTCPTGKTQWLAKVIIDHSIAKEVLFDVQN